MNFNGKTSPSESFYDRFIAKAAVDKKGDGLKFSHAAIGDSSQRIASSIDNLSQS